MADFDLNSIGELFTNGGLSAISRRLRLKEGPIAEVISSGIPSMIAGMQKNVSTKEGEESLSRALSDHAKDDTKDIGAFLKSADLADGKKILGHIFGEEQSETLKSISRSTGVTKGKTTSILAMIAPLLLSSLGSQQSSGLNLGSMLGGLLGGGQQQSTSLLGGLLGSAAQSDDSNQGGILNSLMNLFH